MKNFEGIIVTYHSDDIIPYPEYKGKPYFSIQYEENGEHHVGYGTYNPQVLSNYIKDYFNGRASIVEELEKIKVEIRKLTDINPDYPMDRTIHISRNEVLEIIDKHISELKGENNGNS